ncbi:ABC transporter substrate-binding protein [Nesterenkonia halobia]
MSLPLRAGVVFAAAGMVLTGCGSAAGGDGGDEVTLTFTWWGGQTRHDNTEEMIATFEEENPDISVEAQYGEWNGYWDQLATQSAAQDTPDIMQMDLMYLREYIDNGVLMPLEQVDTSEYADELLATGRQDGEQYAMPVGQTALTFAVNPDVYEEAGLEVPDETSWTWDTLMEDAAAISEETEGYGLSGFFDIAGFEAWLRQQHGVNVFDGEGTVPWSAEDAVPYFEMMREFQDAGALPPAAEMVEQSGIAREQTLLATGNMGLSPVWDTMMIALSSNEGVDLEPLMVPSMSGDASESGLYYKASMFYSVFSGTEHPEAAQKFVDFMVNDQVAGEIQRLERGIPGSAAVRDAVGSDLDGVEARVLDYSNRVSDMVSEAPPIPPQGYSVARDHLNRVEEQFFAGSLDAEQAAEQLHEEATAAIAG